MCERSFVALMKEVGDGSLRAIGAGELTEATAEEIARRVAQLIGDRLCEPFGLLDTHTVARMLAVSDEWVREHAVELGAIRVGDGPKGALRFDVRRVRAALDRRRIDQPKQKQRRRSGRRPSLGIMPAVIPADVDDW